MWCILYTLIILTSSESPVLPIQWNPSLTDTFGEHSFGRYTEVAFVEGLFCHGTNSSFGTCVPGRYIAVGLSSGVAVKRGSTVLAI